MCVSFQRTNNAIERYNRDFNNLFNLPNPGLIAFCEKVKDDAVRGK